MAGCLNNIIWKNKYIKTKVKSRIYKSAIKPLMTYTAETKPDTVQTKRLLGTNEMRILRRITGKTLCDREKSEAIEKRARIQKTSTNGLVKERLNEMNISAGGKNWSRIAWDRSPAEKKSPGRPRKRWSDDITTE